MIASGALAVASPSTEIHKASISNHWEHQLGSVQDMVCRTSWISLQLLLILRLGHDFKWLFFSVTRLSRRPSCSKSALCSNTQVCQMLLELRTPDTIERWPTLTADGRVVLSHMSIERLPAHHLCLSLLSVSGYISQDRYSSIQFIMPSTNAPSHDSGSFVASDISMKFTTCISIVA